MKVQSKKFSVLAAGLLMLMATIAWQTAAAEDVVHAVSGIVKSVDKASKTVVVKTADGTEHTIKWTDKTTVRLPPKQWPSSKQERAARPARFILNDVRPSGETSSARGQHVCTYCFE